MIKELIYDPLFLGIKAKPATKADTVTAKDLLDTLTAHKETCVGMAANMIGKAVCIIAFNDNGRYNLMYNPQIVGRSVPYTTEEGCLSLPGERKTIRYNQITVKYLDKTFTAHTQTFSEYIAQIIQHECDHLEGILI